eukprot:scaffold347_cov380-Prasinococcus_capsulatus_cf.AAC.14
MAEPFLAPTRRGPHAPEAASAPLRPLALRAALRPSATSKGALMRWRVAGGWWTVVPPTNRVRVSPSVPTGRVLPGQRRCLCLPERVPPPGRG